MTDEERLEAQHLDFGGVDTLAGDDFEPEAINVQAQSYVQEPVSGARCWPLEMLVDTSV